MDGDAVRRIEELAEKAAVKVKDGVTFVTSNYKPLGVVHPEPLVFTTLGSFCDYIRRNPQRHELGNAVIKVNQDFTVSLLSGPNPLDGIRDVIAVARRHDTAGFMFGRNHDLESFIISLKSMFVKEDSDWERVFNLVRKVQVKEGIEINDDGMTQDVTVKKGVSSASIERTTVQTDHALRPYRIFPECEQPKSVFFVRLSGNKDDGVYVSLHETDGGAWKNDAAQVIKEFVEERTGDLGIPVYC